MNPEARLQKNLEDAEVKLAFLERELGEYKEAVQDLHARLARLESAVKELQETRPAEGGDQSGED
jgi:chromosome segregation ATPase